VFIHYVDCDTEYCPSWEWAYEATRLLTDAADRMSIRRLHLDIGSCYPSFTIDHPGFWNLLRLRKVVFTLSSPRGAVPPPVRKALTQRLAWSTKRVWTPTSLEKPVTSGKPWMDRVERNPAAQYAWLEERYRFLHDRATIRARTIAARRVRDKRWGSSPLGRRKRRWPRTWAARHAQAGVAARAARQLREVASEGAE
jgi:hypothetical protein